MCQNTEPGAPAPNNSAARSPRRETVRHLLYGSLLGIVREASPLGNRTIKILHKLRYAQPNDWSDPMPTERPNEWKCILTKRLLIE